MNSKLLLAFAVFSLGFVSKSNAVVTLDLQADALRDSAGVLAPVSTLVLLVADTSGNGFGSLGSGMSTSVNSSFGSSDDLILGRFNLVVNNTPGYLGVNPSIDLSLFSGLSTGDAIGIYWFPTLTTASSSIAAGQTYGRFLGPLGAQNGSSAWVIPTDPSTAYPVYFFTNTGTIATGTHLSAEGNASLVVAAAPEPSRALLLLFGLGLSVLRRRRA